MTRRRNGSRGGVLVQLGPAGRDAREEWVSTGLVTDVVDLPFAAPDGRRLGRRALGLGLDSLLVAVLACLRHPRSHYVAANPWVGVALRLLGRSVRVTGIYATPGTRQWEILRRFLADVPVVTTSATEAENWRAEGGAAASVTYGATFGYPARSVSDYTRVRVFVGGSSDRDLDALGATILEAEASGAELDFVLCTGQVHLARDVESLGRVTRYDTVSQEQFGVLIAQSDVVFLPLLESNRSAGHMVAIGALESGVPVVATPTAGMGDYFTLHGLHRAQPGQVVRQLLEVGREGRTEGEAIRRAWSGSASRRAYTQAVAVGFTELGLPK